MRTLTILSVLQTIGIFLLIVHSFRNAGELVAPPSPDSQGAAGPAAFRVDSGAHGATQAVDEQRLRAIIREELADQRSDHAARNEAAAADAASAGGAPAARHQQELIAQQIDAYRAAGSITEAQMLELQAGIAQLGDADRKRMMSKLIRALNAGDIKGRL